jgi:hypothetical protein
MWEDDAITLDPLHICDDIVTHDDTSILSIVCAWNMA